MRSLLLTDAETGGVLAEARQSGAGAVILSRPVASAIASETQAGPLTCIRVDQAEEWSATDIGAIVATAPDEIVLYGVEAGADILRLSAMLAAQEAIAGPDDGAIGIIAVLATAAGVLNAGSFRDSGPRLRGMAWDAAALAASIGAGSAWTAGNGLIAPCRTARSACLLAAAAAGIPAYDTAHSISDISVFRTEAESARQDGFAGKLAVDRKQVAAIDEVFAGARAP